MHVCMNVCMCVYMHVCMYVFESCVLLIVSVINSAPPTKYVGKQGLHETTSQTGFPCPQFIHSEVLSSLQMGSLTSVLPSCRG